MRKCSIAILFLTVLFGIGIYGAAIALPPPPVGGGGSAPPKLFHWRGFSLDFDSVPLGGYEPGEFDVGVAIYPLTAGNHCKIACIEYMDAGGIPWPYHTEECYYNCSPPWPPTGDDLYPISDNSGHEITFYPASAGSSGLNLLNTSIEANVELTDLSVTPNLTYICPETVGGLALVIPTSNEVDNPTNVKLWTYNSVWAGVRKTQFYAACSAGWRSTSSAKLSLEYQWKTEDYSTWQEPPSPEPVIGGESWDMYEFGFDSGCIGYVNLFTTDNALGGTLTASQMYDADTILMNALPDTEWEWFKYRIRAKLTVFGIPDTIIYSDWVESSTTNNI